MDSWIETGSIAGTTLSMRAKTVWVAQTHKTATAITGSTKDKGTDSETGSAAGDRLEGVGLRMPAALAEISSGPAKLYINRRCPQNALVSSSATFTTTENTGVVSMMAEDFGTISIMAGDSDMVALMAGSSGVAAML